ncbi:hypothetical protein P10VF_018 [Rhizobium phage vB_RleM_P10VF]|uniref:Uncharacterized protein n=1 Tax=Rhizobium phage vB_RleM_P10VF TaxID=1527770 RepID=A0A076YPV8_9CAUD|nr:hypothetical protein P10VF_018 [Rhizobium phage vB_RleM_P10VF]AIK68231.1 hypothetical protein P10VF_018 [Rhizobium phage vB_RleM_P10VF]
MSNNVTVISGKKLTIDKTIVISPGVDVEKIFVDCESRDLKHRWALDEVASLSIERTPFWKRVLRKIWS